MRILSNVPRELWSRAIEGDGAELLVHRATGRLVVSTRRVVEQERPAGVERMATVREGDPPVYINQLAERCLALDAGGELAWEHRGLRAVAEAPDGALVAIDDGLALITVGLDGTLRDRRPIEGPWAVVGWTESGQLLLSSEADFPAGAVWMEGAVHALVGGSLLRFDADGAPLAELPVAEAPLRDRWRAGNGPPWPEDLIADAEWDLVADPRRRRLLATSWGLPAWAVALGLDGTVEWAQLMGARCCNFPCLVLGGSATGDDTLVHASSCGQRVSFLEPDGTIFRTHELQHPPDEIVPDGRGGVCVPLQGWGVMAFDARGEPAWAVEASGTHAAAGADRRLYLATRQTSGPLELRAFEVP